MFSEKGAPSPIFVPFPKIEGGMLFFFKKIDLMGVPTLREGNLGDNFNLNVHKETFYQH